MVTWGILGAGSIAGALVHAIRAEGGTVRAVASRSAERVAAFATEFEIEHGLVGYDTLLADPEIDAVYVATTNDLHHRNALDAIAAGKAVLCEKPFALNLAQAEEIAAAARAAGVFVMEAMWMRFIPAIEALLAAVTDGAVGSVQSVHADFAFNAGAGPGHRLVEPSLGGGALLDLGVYTIAFAHLVLGEPSTVKAQARIGASGVDEQVATVLGFPDGSVATGYASFVAASPMEGRVVGTDGYVRVHAPFHNPDRFDVVGLDGATTINEVPHGDTGYRFEIAEVHRALRAGETESPRRPLADTLAIMKILDEVRRQIGVEYPGE
ncbi:MAG: Gfo/Idh/MocA family oxidoreductase [Acidimicrobiia bacterium]|nr:Gfo/Idh/MocA family oxidoreductase [Acidimicrobiia bacterium]NNL68581.1 Gfo/Idh/MocA family oxidoreductase [Acidimicrobiia bacterium]